MNHLDSHQVIDHARKCWTALHNAWCAYAHMVLTDGTEPQSKDSTQQKRFARLHKTATQFEMALHPLRICVQVDGNFPWLRVSNYTFTVNDFLSQNVNYCHLLRQYALGQDQETAGAAFASDMEAHASTVRTWFAKQKKAIVTAKQQALSETAKQALAIIRAKEGKGLTGKEIVSGLKKKKVEITDASFRRHIVAELKSVGVINHRSRGGYCCPDADEDGV